MRGDRGVVGTVQPGLTVHATATGILMPSLELVKDVMTMDLQLAETEMNGVSHRVDGDMPTDNEEVDGDMPNMGGDMPTSNQVETGQVEDVATGVATVEIAIPKICNILKREHDIAKAVKAHDAVVPVELWDEVVCCRPPTNKEKEALASLRVFIL